ncbi:DNA alkylation repair protein [Ornithinimicrobium sufpigmenti]|uniref:DNA alkylation repair protein n=1 Tax=Ornithinimicrobium sufpigmenti TaxID=2508882 RepID=UPI00103611EA|nr:MULTISPECIES: DNA alkylation repair protein [unclassified Ornithinimicrobium]
MGYDVAFGYDVALVDAVRSALTEAADPDRAAGQQAYMKSAMPFHGITTPDLRRILVPVLRQHAPDDRLVWEATVRELWDGATHREQRYAALALAQHRSARAWQDPSVLTLHRHLVVTGAWWDLVDQIATRLVGPVLLRHRRSVTPVIEAWAGADDLWLRRTAILSQLGHREETDTALLERCIAANLTDSDFGDRFFVRKAIGWALRQHARTDPAWVVNLLERYADRLSPLSRREALKHLG